MCIYTDSEVQKITDFLENPNDTLLKYLNRLIKPFQTLRWPSNRNELLQILIRKDWPEAAFKLFHGILQETQKEPLTLLVEKKVISFCKGELITIISC